MRARIPSIINPTRVLVQYDHSHALTLSLIRVDVYELV